MVLKCEKKVNLTIWSFFSGLLILFNYVTWININLFDFFILSSEYSPEVFNQMSAFPLKSHYLHLAYEEYIKNEKKLQGLKIGNYTVT